MVILMETSMYGERVSYVSIKFEHDSLILAFTLGTIETIITLGVCVV